MTITEMIVKALNGTAVIITYVADETKSGNFLPLLLLTLVTVVLVDREMFKFGLFMLMVIILLRMVR